MTDIIKEGIGALIGTFGFTLLFGLKYKKLFVATLGGVLVWALYAILKHFVPSDLFVCNFFPAVLGTMYAQIMARVMKAPATMFVFTSLIVLVPGGMLYYSMSNIILGNTAQGLKLIMDTLEVTVALAFGIVIVMASIKIIYYILNKKNTRGIEK